MNGHLPHTRGKIQSVDDADLLVVKNQMKGYGSADIARIGNTLRVKRKHTNTPIYAKKKILFSQRLSLPLLKGMKLLNKEGLSLVAGGSRGFSVCENL